ncbi:MAG TPA: hypothetical protein VM432_04995 [Bdellovibrionales bacterium]|jgi:hypothetical protein|nr:hypothetical protein [Bdellovibrionales bacterium]
MKPLIYGLIVFAFSAQGQAVPMPSYTFENIGCSMGEVNAAVANHEEMKARFAIGEVTQRDVLIADLAVDETVFCKAAAPDADPETGACHALRGKQQKIVDHSKAEMDVGLITTIEYGDQLMKLGALYRFCDAVVRP